LEISSSPWIFLIVYLLNFFLLHRKNWECLDYAISSKKEFKSKQIQDNELWITTQFVIGKEDTIYYSQYKNWEEVWTDEELKNFDKGKSITQPHYFLRLKRINLFF
jgi:hypothetical protein